MTKLTAKQIYDLNNAMSANQNAFTGSILGNVAQYGTVASGSVLPISASQCLVNTGLTSIYGFTAILSASPSLMTGVSGCVVSGGILNFKSWNSLAAATGFVTFQWTAWGEQ